MSLEIKEGTQIGPYVITRLIGRGGMGDVYLANEERLRRQVALKVINPALAHDKPTLKRFEAEGQTLALINHKNVVSVYAIDQLDGYHFIAMEYIEGKPLLHITRNFVLPAREATPLFLQMLDGLHALHARNVVHRDLKPHNIIFQKDSLIKIIDLGIAKTYNEQNISMTTAGVVLGTVQYLAPEITLGRASSALSDIWAMGAIFYEMLTGAPLIKANNLAQALRMVSNVKVEFPLAGEDAIPAKIQNIVRKMCASDPERRYQSAQEVARDLRAFAQEMPDEGNWHYRYLGRNVKNLAQIRQRLLQSGRSDFQAKQIIFMALQESDGQKNQPINSDKTVALEVEAADELLTEELLKSAINNLNRGTRAHRRQRHLFGFAKAMGALAAVASLGTLGWMDWPQKEIVMPQPEVVSAPTVPSPPAVAQALAKVPAPEPTSVPVPMPVPVADAPPVEEAKPAPVAAPVMQPKAKSQISFTTLTPKIHQDEIALILEDNFPELSWDSLQGANSYQLQISRDRQFKKIEFTKLVPKSKFVWEEAGPGKYYWRVRARNVSGRLSNFSSIGNLAFTIPPVSLPAEINRAGTASFQINWAAPKFETQFRVLISRDPAFASTDKSFIVRKPAADLSMSEPGIYYTKVAAVDANEAELSSYSNISKITLKEVIQMGAPSLMSPPQDATIPSHAGKVMLLMMWRKVDRASTYELQIAQDENFSHPLVQKEVPTNRLTLKQKMKVGVHYWRVRAKSAKGESPWSTGRFDLQ